MILQNHIRGRRRVLDAAKKARLCELISKEAYSVEQAADALDVSLRTIQRERRYDQDFDHEVRLALQSPPDPLKLMEHAARTHWRAAAWLLERTNPEDFARKPVNTTSPKQVLSALRHLQETALRAIPAELHETVYQQTQAAIDESFGNCFPMMGEWGKPKLKKLPIETPLADVQYDKVWRAQIRITPDRTPPVDDRFEDRPEEYIEVEVATDLGPIEVSLPPDHYRHMQTVIAAAKARSGEEDILSPKIAETTEFPPATKSAAATEFEPTTKSPPATINCDPAAQLAMLEERVSTVCPEAWYENDDFDHPDAQDPSARILLLDERLRRHQRRERQKERAADKKVKAAKKRAQAQRRRAA